MAEEIDTTRAVKLQTMRGKRRKMAWHAYRSLARTIVLGWSYDKRADFLRGKRWRNTGHWDCWRCPRTGYTVDTVEACVMQKVEDYQPDADR